VAKKVIVSVVIATAIAIALVLANRTSFYTSEQSDSAEPNANIITTSPVPTKMAMLGNSMSETQTDPELASGGQVPSNEALADQHDYIVDCPQYQPFNEEGAGIYYTAITDYFASLINANSQDEQLWYALFANPTEGSSRLDMLIDYNKRFANDPLAALGILRECATSAADTLCEQSLLDEAIESDPNNGAMWYNLANIYAVRNEDEAAVNAINELIESPFFNDGYIQNIQMFLLALEGSQSNQTGINLMSAIGTAAAFTAPGTVATWCNKNSTHPIKSQSCLQLGIYLETQSKTLFDQSIGEAIQELIYEAQGNNEAFKQRLNKREAPDRVLTIKAGNLLFYDEKLMSAWLSNFQKSGEAAAFRLLYEEAIVLSKNENYRPCEVE
jgi:hypothetical protein